MKNLKIKTKLFMTFGIIMVLFVGCIVMSMASLNQIDAEVQSYITGPVTIRNTVNRMNANFESMQKWVYRSISTDSVAETQACEESIQSSVQALQSELQSLKEIFTGDPALITGLEECLEKMIPHREHVLQLAREMRNEEAYTYMNQNNVPLIEEAQGYIAKIISYSEDRNRIISDSLSGVQARSFVLLVVLGITSLVISVGFGIYITRGISYPVQELVDVARNLASGILHVDIKYHSRDEMGLLADNMREMSTALRSYIEDLGYGMSELSKGNLTAKPSADFKGDFVALKDNLASMFLFLNETMGMIGQTAIQVSSGSQQVSDAAQTMAQGATEQASSVQQLSASITEISTQVTATASNAKDANNAVTLSSERVAECDAHMEKLTAAMEEINVKSQEIGKIIKTIDDIAFQTNILALNAAVEAARAGQHGKGFAVVADEVRNLAAKSAAAASDTTTLIEGSVAAVEKGAMFASDTAQSLKSVIEQSRLVSNSVQQIAHAAQEQSLAIAQVTAGVEQISTVVQGNAATAEQSAAASEEMSSQAQILKAQMAKFTLIESDEALTHTAVPASKQKFGRETTGISLGGGDKY